MCFDNDYNSGIFNEGMSNQGSYNFGWENHGSSNTGDFNMGFGNSGYWNVGLGNSGDFNVGKFNSGSNNFGYFNTTENETIRLFNKDTGLTEDELDLPEFSLPLTYLNDDNELLTRTYHEAWNIVWKRFTKKDKDKFLNLPNFDSKIFEEITGICLLKLITGE